MFARTVLAIFVGVAAMTTSAAPLGSRQIGNLECNLDRLEIVAGLAKTQSSLKKLATSVADDADASAAVSATASSITTAQGAIGVIAKALLTGSKAPADARDTVLTSLTAATDSLAKVASTDPAVTAAITSAQAELEQSKAAGNGVVSNCK